MSGQGRRLSVSSTASYSSSIKRPATAEIATTAVVPHASAALQKRKKRPALANLTNQANVGRNVIRTAGDKVQSASSASKTKKGISAHVATTGLQRNSLCVPPIVKLTTTATVHNNTSVKRNEEVISSALPNLRPCNSTFLPTKAIGTAVSAHETLSTCESLLPPSLVKQASTSSQNSTSLKKNDGVSVPPVLQTFNPTLSPSVSDAASISMDESMSTCESLNSPDIEYIDNGDSSAVASLERRTCNNLYISEGADTKKGDVLRKDFFLGSGENDVVMDLDDNYNDPQLCASFASDIYEHLHEAETKKRPSTDFMERIQKDINASMRSILIDWLVEVAEEYRLVPDTLYLAVNYIDRYLSSNVMNRQRLQLLGVSCVLIAAKYEEISAPSVEEFCYITDNTYFKEEVLEMESAVLRHLKYEMTAPTTKCFLRRFIRAAQGSSEVSALQIEFLASYVSELSLLDYGMLRYAPSLIAASAIFLAKAMLLPKKMPWNPTMAHYTSYKPSALCECVRALHRLVCNSESNTLPAIREKYSQHKYKSVASISCPSTIPCQFFQDL